MGLPITPGGIARKFYRDARGRFTTKKLFEREQRRSLRTAKFTTKRQATLERQQEVWLTEKLGRAPPGQHWVQLAAKYADRFEDLTNDMNAEL